MERGELLRQANQSLPTNRRKRIHSRQNDAPLQRSIAITV